MKAVILLSLLLVGCGGQPVKRGYTELDKYSLKKQSCMEESLDKHGLSVDDALTLCRYVIDSRR